MQALESLIDILFLARGPVKGLEIRVVADLMRQTV